MYAITLKPGREKSLLRKHPWIFSGAIASAPTCLPGETVNVFSANGQWLARAAWSPESQIAGRVWSFNYNEQIDANFFQRRLDNAFALRAEFLEQPENACRLVNAESDLLPGLIIDRYSNFLVCQFLSMGVEAHRNTIIHALQYLLPHFSIYDRSDVDVRAKEGLENRTGVLAGQVPPDLIEIDENNCRFFVDIKQGHKTGFYLDQRDNRALLASMCEGGEVLNLFSYTGGFGIAAAVGHAASVTNVDSSASALDLAAQHITLNNIASRNVNNIRADAFVFLRECRDSGRQFDVIVLDPPKFAESQSQLERAARGYKDINLLALKLLNPGGLLFTFSCSGLMHSDLFQKIVADAALDAGRDAQIIMRMSQAQDHPTLLSFPEGFYLKGLVCQVL